MNPNKLITLLILFALFSCKAFGLKTDIESPIQITANQWEGNQKTQVNTFYGNVIANQGSIHVTADTATVSQNAAGHKFVHLSGKPVFFSQLDDDGQKIEAQANDFTYNTQNNLAILIGRARVKKGDNIVTGDKITYNTQTQIYNASGTSANGVNQQKSGRITVILQPTKEQNGQSSAKN